MHWFSHKNYFSSSHNIFFCRRDFIFKILVLTAAAAAAFGASPCKVISFFRKKSILNISRIATTWTGMPAEQESSLASQRPPRHLLPQRLTLKLTTCSPKKLLMSRLKKKRKGRTVRFISQIILYHQSNDIYLFFTKCSPQADGNMAMISIGVGVIFALAFGSAVRFLIPCW